jgi:L-asparaginase
MSATYTKQPLQIQVIREGVRESLHLVHAVVADSQGCVASSWADFDFLTLPRSVVKPLQAIQLILSGAAERFQMSAVELVMACSSHGA